MTEQNITLNSFANFNSNANSNSGTEKLDSFANGNFNFGFNPNLSNDGFGNGGFPDFSQSVPSQNSGGFPDFSQPASIDQSNTNTNNNTNPNANTNTPDFSNFGNGSFGNFDNNSFGGFGDFGGFGNFGNEQAPIPEANEDKTEEKVEEIEIKEKETENKVIEQDNHKEENKKKGGKRKNKKSKEKEVKVENTSSTVTNSIDTNNTNSDNTSSTTIANTEPLTDELVTFFYNIPSSNVSFEEATKYLKGTMELPETFLEDKEKIESKYANIAIKENMDELEIRKMSAAIDELKDIIRANRLKTEICMKNLVGDKESEGLISRIKTLNYIGSNDAIRKRNAVMAVMNYNPPQDQDVVINLYEYCSIMREMAVFYTDIEKKLIEKSYNLNMVYNVLKMENDKNKK